MAAHSPPRVDPRVTRTRKLIREALTSLLAEKSFGAVNVQDIAEQATINRATFYAHYTDKFDLLDGLVREDIAAHLAQGDPLNAGDVRSILQAVGKNVFAFVVSHGKCRIDREFDSQFQHTVETELTNFLVPAFGQSTAIVVASAFVGAAMNWRHHTPTAPTQPVVSSVVTILVDGVNDTALQRRDPNQ